MNNIGEFNVSENTKTLAAVISVINEGFIRFWIALVSITKLILYFVYPISESWTDVDIIDSFHRHDNKLESLYKTMFAIVCIILAQFAAMTYFYTFIMCLVISWDKQGSYYKASRLYGMEQVMTPFACSILFILTILSINFEFSCQMTEIGLIMNIVWCVIYVGLIAFLLYLLCGLMSLQDKSSRVWDRFHSFVPPLTIIIVFEGVGMLFANAAFVAILLFHVLEKNPYDCNETAFAWFYLMKQSLIFCFNICVMFMAYSLRSIAAEPSFRQYFQKQKKFKYIVGFRLICFFATYHIIYEIIFEIVAYTDSLYNYGNNESKLIRVSFAMCFCLIYYELWVIEQFSKWIFYSSNGLENDANISVAPTSDVFSIKTKTNNNENENNVLSEELIKKKGNIESLSGNEKIEYLMQNKNWDRTKKKNIGKNKSKASINESKHSKKKQARKNVNMDNKSINRSNIDEKDEKLEQNGSKFDEYCGYGSNALTAHLQNCNKKGFENGKLLKSEKNFKNSNATHKSDEEATVTKYMDVMKQYKPDMKQNSKKKRNQSELKSLKPKFANGSIGVDLSNIDRNNCNNDNVDIDDIENAEN